jgi:hypothetical protein
MASHPHAQSGGTLGTRGPPRPLRPELPEFRPLDLVQASADTNRPRRTSCDSARLLYSRCCTAQLGSPSTDACAGDSSCASTRSRVPSVSVRVTAQTDLVALMGLCVFAMFPVVAVTRTSADQTGIASRICTSELVAMTRSRRNFSSAKSLAYCARVRSRPVCIASIWMSSSFAQCGPG